MRLLIVLLLSVCAVGSGGSLRLLVDAKSPAEYNRWLWEHRAESLDIPPVYITCDSFAYSPDRHYVHPAVSFWTDSGTQLLHRVLPDSWSSVVQSTSYGIPPPYDQLVVSGLGRNVHYDRYGQQVPVDFGPGYIGRGRPGRWFRRQSGWNAAEGRHVSRLQVLDDSGRTVVELKSGFSAEMLSVSESSFFARVDSSVLWLDRDGNIRWRSPPLHFPRAVASKDGWAVAVITRDSLLVHDERTGMTYGADRDDERSKFGRLMTAWSADGQQLAFYQGSKTSQDSGRLLVYDRKARLARPIQQVRAYHVRALLWAGDTVVLPAQDVDTSSISGKPRNTPTDSCLVTFVPPAGKPCTAVLHGRFRAWGDWHLSRRYLAHIEVDLDFETYVIAEIVR